MENTRPSQGINSPNTSDLTTNHPSHNDISRLVNKGKTSNQRTVDHINSPPPILQQVTSASEDTQPTKSAKKRRSRKKKTQYVVQQTNIQGENSTTDKITASMNYLFNAHASKNFSGPFALLYSENSEISKCNLKEIQQDQSGSGISLNLAKIKNKDLQKACYELESAHQKIVEIMFENGLYPLSRINTPSFDKLNKLIIPDDILEQLNVVKDKYNSVKEMVTLRLNQHQSRIRIEAQRDKNLAMPLFITVEHMFLSVQLIFIMGIVQKFSIASPDPLYHDVFNDSKESMVGVLLKFLHINYNTCNRETLSDISLASKFIVEIFLIEVRLLSQPANNGILLPIIWEVENRNIIKQSTDTAFNIMLKPKEGVSYIHQYTCTNRLTQILYLAGFFEDAENRLSKYKNAFGENYAFLQKDPFCKNKNFSKEFNTTITLYSTFINVLTRTNATTVSGNETIKQYLQINSDTQVPSCDIITKLDRFETKNISIFNALEYIFKSLHKVSNHPATILFRCSITKQDKIIWVIPQEFVAMKNVATKNLIDYDINITQLLDKIEEHIENATDIKNLNIKRELENLLKIMPAEFAGIDNLSINNYNNLVMRNQSSLEQSIILDIYDDLINTSQVIHYYSSLFAIFNKQQNYETGLSYVNFNQSKKLLNERIANIKIQYKTDYKNHLQSLVAENTKDNTPMKLLTKDMSATENHDQLVEQNLDLVDSAPGYAQQQENISTIFYPTKDLQNAITSATTTKAKAKLVDEYEKQAQEDIRQSNLYLQNNLQLKSKQLLTELLEIDDLEDPECIKSKCNNLEALETSIIGSIMEKYIITHALCTSCSIIITQTYNDKDSEFLNNMDEILNNGKLLNHENLHKFNSIANKYLKNINTVEQSMKVAIEYFNELINKAKKYELPAIYLLENIINIQHILKECADNFFKVNELLQKIHYIHITKGRLLTQIRNKNNGNHNRGNSERYANIKLKQKSFFNSLKDVVANKDTTFFTFINNINASLLEIDAVISN